MPLEVKPAPKLTYKLRLSPRVRLSLNLLQLPLIKLKEYVQQEIEKNPLLELVDTKPRLPKETEIPWTEEDEEKRKYKESLISSLPTLQEHLQKQLRLLTTSKNECEIGEAIIGNINDDGYLKCSVDDIAKSMKTTKSQVRKILALIQTFDPIGVGARDLRECLLLQLNPHTKIFGVGVKVKGEKDSLAGQIVDKFLPFLEKKRYEHIAKKLSAKGGSTSGGKVSVKRIKEAIKEILRLEPNPGLSFNFERPIYIIPDAILRKEKDGHEVILNDWELPGITLSDKYKEMMKQKDISEDTKEYLKEKLKEARFLIDAVNRRKETIQKVIEDIATIQRDFLDNGEANLKPMTLEQIAKRVGKHKSTVSRAIANKYIQTPQGIFELRYFLSSGIKQKNDEFYSSKNVKFKIAELIRKENKRKPLTDEEIANQLRKNGISVSRRAITKYRGQLKILSSKSRQR